MSYGRDGHQPYSRGLYTFPSKGGMTIPNKGSLDPGTYTYTMHGSYESPIAQGTNVFDGLGTTDGRMANGHGFLDCWVWLFYREKWTEKGT